MGMYQFVWTLMVVAVLWWALGAYIKRGPGPCRLRGWM